MGQAEIGATLTALVEDCAISMWVSAAASRGITAKTATDGAHGREGERERQQEGDNFDLVYM